MNNIEKGVINDFPKIGKCIKVMRRVIKDYENTYSDPKFKKVVKDDCESFDAIIHFLEIGAVKAAWDYANMMDTLPRECIPDFVWEFMEKSGKSEKH